jgi:hypothetical protein
MKQLNKMVRSMNKVNSRVKNVEVLMSGNPGKMVNRAKNKFLFEMMMKMFRKMM